MQRLRALLVLCLLAWPLSGPAFADQTLSECQCLDCLKLWRLSAEAEREAYNSRWAQARANLQEQIDSYNSDPKVRADYAAEGKLLFCELWSTFGDELDVVRELELPKIQKRIFANAPQCLGSVGGSTSPLTCEVDALMAAVNEMKSPCPQIHLATLAHELVHAQDCQANPERPTWMEVQGATCAQAFAGKTPPSAEAFMRFAEAAFATEVKAHDIESRVEALLQAELTLMCRPDDFSNRQTYNDPEAVDFLTRARAYGTGGTP